MSFWLQKLAAFALLCTATAACDEARGGFLAPELNEPSAATTSSAKGHNENHAPEMPDDSPQSSLVKQIGMSGQTAPAPFGSGGALTVCDCLTSRLELAVPVERLWLGVERASPCLGFQFEILRPPRV